MYLGYALHPIQDIYAHTEDKCYRSLVPQLTYYNENGIEKTKIVFRLGWSHVRNTETDIVTKRGDQINKTQTHTMNILNTFVKSYKKILTKDVGVRL